MGKLVLVTGGARSGKSTFAENLLQQQPTVLYIATAVPLDDEMKSRIEHHQSQRNPLWRTLEAFHNIPERILQEERRYGGILLDCITVMLTNLLFIDSSLNLEDYEEQYWSNFERETINQIETLLTCLTNYSDLTVLVTNEIGLGLVPETAFARAFRDLQGRVNQYLARRADEAYLVVSGIPLKLKRDNNE